MNRVIGYVSVSKKQESGQIVKNIELYAEERAREAVIYMDFNIKGKHKPELEQALKAVAKGDIFVVYQLEQLSKNTKRLFAIINDLEERGIAFVSLMDQFDTTLAEGRTMLKMFRVLQSYEARVIEDRTLPGREAARQLNKKGGRPAVNNQIKRRIWKLYSEGESVAAIGKEWGVAPSTVYKIINQSSFLEDLKAEHKKNKWKV